MKYLSILILLLCVCSTTKEPSKNQVVVPFSCVINGNNTYNYSTVVIDSCEYVFVAMGNASWGSHKGNCKFCEERILCDTL